jgi:hypothetical protein
MTGCMSHRSPFSGQLMAVTLYNAAWLVLIFAIVRRSVRSTAGVALFTAALVLALGFADSNIFAGIWFPHLYVLPFATVVLAASRLVYGKLDSLIALGVSTGFLLNGHVSFVAIVGIVMICVLAANYVIARRSETPGYWRRLSCVPSVAPRCAWWASYYCSWYLSQSHA